MAVFGDVRAFCARRVALKEGERVEFELQEVRSWLDLRLSTQGARERPLRGSGCAGLAFLRGLEASTLRRGMKRA